MASTQSTARWSTLALCAAVMALTPDLAHAYLDPATGSIILQMIMGGVAGAALLVKLGWRRFLGFFGVGSPPPSQEEDGPSGG